MDSAENKLALARLRLAIIMLVIAIVAALATTAAWFSISDKADDNNLRLQITSTNSLRFDLDAHPTFWDYIKTLGFDQIAARMQSEQGFDMQTDKLRPVTTEDAQTFTLQDGTVVEASTGSYLEFTLHFMSLQDLVVHLTSQNGEGEDQGTRISSEVQGLPEAMRISFTADGHTWIYDPNLGNSSETTGSITRFGLLPADQMVIGDENALFATQAETDKPVVVHVWLEGTDQNCTNDLRGADYSISLRFEGV